MTDVSVPATRVGRGIELARLRGGEIERTAPFTWRVPSCSGSGTYYVYLDILRCSCPDHERARELGEKCKHIIAAEIVAAKRRVVRASA